MHALCENWMVPIRNLGGGSPRLVCFPHAGGGAAIFRGWSEEFLAGVDLFALQPPGREGRFAEPPLADFRDLVRRATAALLPFTDVPLALFGHSLGALVAYEVARGLERHGATPAVLFVSGRQAPHLPSRRAPIAHLPDAAFVREMVQLDGTPAEVAASPELIALLLPMLRADFGLAEGYRPLPGARLTCPVVALGSHDDPWIDPPGLQAWQGVTCGAFATHMFPGNHFYLLRHRAQLLSYLGERIVSVSPPVFA